MSRCGPVARLITVSLVAVLAFAVVPSVYAASPAEGPSAAELRDRARSIVADSRYQDRLDDGRTPMRDLPPARRMVRRSSGTRTPRADPTSAGGSGIGTVIMWTLLGVLGACLIFFVANELAHRRRRKKKQPKSVLSPALATGDDVVEDTMPATLKNAKKLAAEGRLEDAIHLLLTGAIDYVAQLARFFVGDAMTSREVLTGASLDDASHQAFGQLVTSVEVSLFGGESATASDFDRCAAAFQHLHGRLQP